MTGTISYAINQGHITPEEGSILINNTPNIIIIDVRDCTEFKIEHFNNAINIPIGVFEERISEIPYGSSVLLYCIRGIRSWRAMEILLESRPDLKVYHIFGVPVFTQ